MIPFFLILMAVVRYRVKIEHSDKGVGFTVKKRLAEYIGRGLIKDVRMEDANNKETYLLIGVKDATLQDSLRQLMENGDDRNSRKYSVKEIVLAGGEKNGNEEKRAETAEARLKRVEQDNELLRANVENLERQAATRPTISSPLEGILCTFDRKSYDLRELIKDEKDQAFLRKVRLGRSENVLLDYCIHNELTTIAVQEDIEKYLAINYESERDALANLKREAENAQQANDYAREIEEGKKHFDLDIRKNILRKIREKNFPEQIRKYEEAAAAFSDRVNKYEMISALRTAYERIKEDIELLLAADQPLPVVFDSTGDTLDIYFPAIRARTEAKTVNALCRDIVDFFPDVKSIEHRFVAYRSDKNKKEKERMIQEVPFTLVVCGFDRITPYILGE